MTKNDRMNKLIEQLNKAAKVYYQGQDEIMSNLEYDKLYDELVALEKETGIVLGNSPTVNVGYETLSELPKEAHVAPMLSLDKTKEVETLAAFAGEQPCVLSLKLDGLSVIMTYEEGKLVKALTRGNGEIGEVITNNAMTFQNVPRTIPYQGHLIVRGEALIKYSDFEELNGEFAEIGEKYKNPRNLCSGSVRQLNNEITAKRRVNYILYNIIETDETMSFHHRTEQLNWLSSLGFTVVPYKEVTGATMTAAVKEFSEEIMSNDLPSDGLVLAYDDLDYSRTLGRTAKFPRDSIAFKWQDELAQTTLLEVEWSASRTGLINPVAIFEPVELEGTTVSRASVHNVSILKQLELGIGDKITVYKANMIIPQIQENLTKSNHLEIPKECPVCHEPTSRINENGSEVLMCTNPACLAKKNKSFAHFASRNAMNIDGLSEATIEKLIAKGMIHELADLFHLDQYREEFTKMEGFGEKSFENLLQSVEKARKITLPRLIYSLGIKGIGLSMAKLICNQYPFSLTEMSQVSEEDLAQIDGVGPILAHNFWEYFSKEDNQKRLEHLWQEVTILEEAKSEQQSLAGLTFVITGSLNHFENRNEAKEMIEKLGGKVTGSVTKNTNYLVNNDLTSQSSKNKKAKELGVPIISEEMLLDLFKQE